MTTIIITITMTTTVISFQEIISVPHSWFLLSSDSSDYREATRFLRLLVGWARVIVTSSKFRKFCHQNNFTSTFFQCFFFRDEVSAVLSARSKTNLSLRRKCAWQKNKWKSLMRVPHLPLRMPFMFFPNFLARLTRFYCRSLIGWKIMPTFVAIFFRVWFICLFFFIINYVWCIMLQKLIM